jgi:hypothetical protein
VPSDWRDCRVYDETQQNRRGEGRIKFERRKEERKKTRRKEKSRNPFSLPNKALNISLQATTLHTNPHKSVSG